MNAKLLIDDQRQGAVMGIEIAFGALCDPIDKQLREQGHPLKAASIFQKDADALTWLSVRGLLPDAQVRQARKKLLRRIVDELVDD